MRRIVAIALAAAVTVVLVACGDDDSGGEQSGSGPATLTVGILPIVETAPLTIAQQQGFFEEENLSVKTEMAPGGAAIIPAVLSGSQQIGWGNTPSTLIAAARGLPIRVIAPGASTGVGDEDVSAVVVGGEGNTRKPADLVGESVAVPTLSSLAEYASRSALAKLGADDQQIDFIEVPFPEMPPALASGDVAAAFVVEPFRTIALAQGARPLLQPFSELSDEPFETTQWVTSEQYLQENPDVVARFTRAIAKANRYAQEHPEAVRQALLEYTEIPEPIAQKIRLPQWSEELDRPSYELLEEVTREAGDLEGDPNLDELLVTDPGGS
jgi:NitT/TauT family transport system substrate-binding protein